MQEEDFPLIYLSCAAKTFKVQFKTPVPEQLDAEDLLPGLPTKSTKAHA